MRHGCKRGYSRYRQARTPEDLEALPIALPEGVDYSANIIATYVAQYPARIDMRAYEFTRDTDADGTPDASFGTDGLVVHSSVSGTIYDLTLDSDGNIYLGGRRSGGGGRVCRLSNPPR